MWAAFDSDKLAANRYRREECSADMRLEVVVLSVSDIDRAKEFYTT